MTTETKAFGMLDYLQVLKTFVAVVDRGSMVAAARDVGYTAGAVTRQMGWLQNHLGVRLFEPEGRSIRPTPEAVELVPGARAVLEQAEQFRRRARGLIGAP